MVAILLIKEVLLNTKQNKNHALTALIKVGCISIALLSFVGCSSLGGGSVQKRATKLSYGIQKAYAVSPATANRISPMIVQSADQYHLDPLMMAALIRQESTYRSQVVSSAGAVGLTQVMPRYWQQTCLGNLYDEATNINCGSFILAKYEQSAGSLKKALGYYNVGPSNFENNRKMRKQGKRYAKQVKVHEKNLKRAL